MKSILLSTPENPRPDYEKVGYFNGCDGKFLRYGLFRSSAQDIKGTIILLQGRNETIEKYYETIKDLTAAGFWVATFDWRGQGGSERILTGHKLGYVEQFKDYEDDLNIFLEQIVFSETQKPFFALAHSMGGLILLSSAPRFLNHINRIILVSPFLGLPVTGIKKLAMRGFLFAANLMGWGKLPIAHKANNDPVKRFNSLTSDQKRYARNQEIFRSFPKLETGKPTIRWLTLMIKTIARISRKTHLKQMRIPMIILAGRDDGIVPFKTLDDITNKLPNARLIPFDGARHEILNEIDLYRKPALAAIVTFFTTINRALV